MSDRLPTWRIASPCSVGWDDMTGDDHVRRCARCDQNVFNLSALTSRQAEDLLERTSGQICTTFFQRSDGTVLTADCPEARWQRLRHRVSSASAVAAASLLTLWTTVAPGRGGRIERALAAMADPTPPPPMLGGAPPPNRPPPPPPDTTKKDHRRLAGKPMPKTQTKE